MKLIVETLQTNLEQEILYNSDQRIHIASIIPYLYSHNLKSGVFKFDLIKGSEVVFSKEFTWEDIKGEIDKDYFHVYYPVVPSDPLQLERGLYKFKISAVSGYIAGGTSFLGWIKQFEDKQLPMNYVPLSDIQNTFTLRFKEYVEEHYYG
jgi:hypothetical protein